MPRSGRITSLMRACVANITFSLALILAWQISQRELWLTATLESSAVLEEKQRVEETTNVSVSVEQPENSIPVTGLRNLRLVFVGDSLTRYQYLSLAYFLRHGQWWESPSREAPNNLVNAHSFHHPAHPQEDWNEFFLQSNRMLYPMEACDCVRSQNASRTVMERRYFFDKANNNKLVYINLNGNKTHGSWGFYGRFTPEQVFQDFDRTIQMPVGFNALDSQNTNRNNFTWEYATWGEVLREHVGNLGLGSNATVILNAGMHRHNFGGGSVPAQKRRADIRDSLAAIGMQGIWKTTTFKKSQLQDYTVPARIRSTDRRMCELLGQCFNLSWTSNLRPELYFDELHMLEPVYRAVNEELLENLRVLPAGYQSLDRSTLFRTANA